MIDERIKEANKQRAAFEKEKKEAEKERQAETEKKLNEVSEARAALKEKERKEWEADNWPMVKIVGKWQKRKGHFDGHKFIIE